MSLQGSDVAPPPVAFDVEATTPGAVTCDDAAGAVVPGAVEPPHAATAKADAARIPLQTKRLDRTIVGPFISVGRVLARVTGSAPIREPSTPAFPPDLASSLDAPRSRWSGIAETIAPRRLCRNRGRPRRTSDCPPDVARAALGLPRGVGHRRSGWTPP